MPVRLDRIDSDDAGPVRLDKIDTAVKTQKPVRLDAIEAPARPAVDFGGKPPGALTPAENAEDDARDRSPANQAELERGVREAPTLEARRLIEDEKARIANGPQPIDTSRPIIENPDGSFSTERTVTVEMDGKHVVIPTIVDGKPRTTDEAVQLHRAGKNPAVGTFNTQAEADAYATRRSQEIGKVRQQDRPVGVNRAGGLKLPAERPVAMNAKPPAPRAPSVGLRPPADLYLPQNPVEPFARDVIPGLVETGVGGLYNMYAGGLSALPAAIAAAFPDTSDKSSNYIDRFTELQRDIAHRLEYEPHTTTGKVLNDAIGGAVTWGLDSIGDIAERGGGPIIGAYVKGAAAALLAAAGMGRGLGLKPDAVINRTLEPRFDPITDVGADARPEPRLDTQLLRPPYDPDRVEPKLDANRRRDPITIITGDGRREPTVPDQLPDVPLSRIEKPRLKGKPATVADDGITAPLGAAALAPAPAPEPDVGQSSANRPTTDIQPPRGADPVLDAPVRVDLFDDMFKVAPKGPETALESPTARAPENVPEGIPERTAAKEDQLPPAPRGVTRPEDDLGFVTPDPDTEYSAVRHVASDVREGGKEGGAQFVKLPQNLFWKGATGKVDAALFDAGKQFKTESADPKVRGDAIRNKEAAFDRLQEALRYLMFEDRTISPEAKAPYREFLTDDGTQISRDKLIRGAMGYNVRVSTLMKNARRANEGQGVAIEVPGWRGKGDMPTPQGSPKPAPKAPPKAEAPPADELPAAPKAKKEAQAKPADADPLKDAIVAMKGEIGQVEAGGRIIIDEVNRDKTPGTGDVLGRTVPIRAEWWFRRPVKLSAAEARTALDKFGAGEKLSRREQNFVDYVRGVVEQLNRETEEFRASQPGGMTDSEALDQFGPGTLGANPMFNPQVWAATLKRAANALDKSTPKAARNWLDAAQGTPAMAMPALASVWSHARRVSAAKHQAELDIYHKTPLATLTRDWHSAMNEARQLDPKYMQGKAPPQTVREVIQQTELARRHSSKIIMHRELVASGMASPVPAQGYSASTIGDLRTGSGRPLWIKDEAQPVVRQMVGAHDVAAQAESNSTLLGAMEAVNHASVGLIMYNPGFHAVTVAGRAAPFIINRMGKNSILLHLPEAGRMLADRDLMYDLMKNKGYQPMRVRDSMEALGGQMGTIERIFRDNGLGKPYDFWRYVHNKVMVGTVNHIQAAVFLMKRDDLLAQGIPRDAAELSAARFSNMIGGNLPKEEMQQLWHQILGASMFSRGYTSTVVRQTTRAIVQDKILMAALQKQGFTPDVVAKVVDAHRADLAKALMLDYFVMQVVGNTINYAATDGVEDRNGVKRRHFAYDNKPKDRPMGSKPEAIDYLFPDRIAIGKAKDGNDLYMENPLRTTRDQFLFFMQGKELAAGEKPRWLSRKLGTLAGLLEDASLGEQRGGRPMRDSLDVAANVADRMTPFDFRSAAEATRMASFDYFKDAVFNAFSDPSMLALKTIGLQPHIENPDPTAAASRKVQHEQNKVWAEAAEIRSHWETLGPAARADALKRLEEIGAKMGIKEHVLEKYVSEQEATKGQRKRARIGEGLFDPEGAAQ